MFVPPHTAAYYADAVASMHAAHKQHYSNGTQLYVIPNKIFRVPTPLLQTCQRKKQNLSLKMTSSDPDVAGVGGECSKLSRKYLQRFDRF